MYDYLTSRSSTKPIRDADLLHLHASHYELLKVFEHLICPPDQPVHEVEVDVDAPRPHRERKPLAAVQEEEDEEDEEEEEEGEEDEENDSNVQVQTAKRKRGRPRKERPLGEDHNAKRGYSPPATGYANRKEQLLRGRRRAGDSGDEDSIQMGLLAMMLSSPTPTCPPTQLVPQTPLALHFIVC